MHPFPHRYTVSVLATPAGVVTLRSRELEDIQSSAPPEFGGPEGNWSPETLFVAAAGGGIWKTTDGGVYWRCVCDGFMTSAAVGAIAVTFSTTDPAPEDGTPPRPATVTVVVLAAPSGPAP